VIISILAWAGALLSCMLAIPQAIQTLRSDRLEGISTATYWIILSNATVWATWSLFTGQHAAGIPALVNGPAALLILHRLHRTTATATGEAARTSRNATRAESPIHGQSLVQLHPRPTKPAPSERAARWLPAAADPSSDSVA
jgi:uncharacterized protein with PQ loop repeat